MNIEHLRRLINNNNYLLSKKYLDKGIIYSLNIQDQNGNTPLHLASEKKNIEFIKLLLEHGAIVNIQNILEDTPLHISCKKEEPNVEIIKLLLHNDCVNLKNKRGQTPLFLSCLYVNMKIIKLLLDNGAKDSINEKDNGNETPLHIAGKIQKIDLTRLLLENGAIESINIIDFYKKTPLQNAMKGPLDKIELLIQNGGILSNFYDLESYDINKIKLLLKYNIINKENINYILDLGIYYCINKKKHILLLYIYKNYNDINEIDEKFKKIINDNNRIIRILDIKKQTIIDKNKKNRKELLLYQYTVAKTCVQKLHFIKILSSARKDWLMHLSSFLSEDILLDNFPNY